MNILHQKYERYTHISFTFHVSYLQINAVIQEVYTFYNFLYAAQGYSSKNSIILSAISSYVMVSFRNLMPRKTHKFCIPD